VTARIAALLARAPATPEIKGMRLRIP
jgi:hypothetical protein